MRKLLIFTSMSLIIFVANDSTAKPSLNNYDETEELDWGDEDENEEKGNYVVDNKIHNAESNSAEYLKKYSDDKDDSTEVVVTGAITKEMQDRGQQGSAKWRSFKSQFSLKDEEYRKIKSEINGIIDSSSAQQGTQILKEKKDKINSLYDMMEKNNHEMLKLIREDNSTGLHSRDEQSIGNSTEQPNEQIEAWRQEDLEKLESKFQNNKAHTK
ncbi:MAG: hypothetical protein LBJ45_02375 [Holosporaceae bacterium]|nr:hypothetical protein [Holosporaceae bacterium]